jgi:hypothetical protein
MIEDEDEDDKAAAEVEPGTLKEDAPQVDPDLPETDAEDLGGEGDDDAPDPLYVVLPVNHAKQLVDLIRTHGLPELADAFLAAEAGESIIIRVEAV